MELNHLHNEMDRLNRDYLKGNSFRPFVKPAFGYDEQEHKRNCSMPHIDEDKKTLVNAHGVPYRIEKIGADSSQSQELEEEGKEEEDKVPAQDHDFELK